MIKNYLKKHEKYSILIFILLIILSIFLIWKPLKSIEIFVILFGMILIINGLGNFTSYFTISKDERLYSTGLIMGLMTTISGIFLLISELVNLINSILIIQKLNKYNIEDY